MVRGLTICSPTGYRIGGLSVATQPSTNAVDRLKMELSDV